jgi:hypothetical protein
MWPSLPNLMSFFSIFGLYSTGGNPNTGYVPLSMQFFISSLFYFKNFVRRFHYAVPYFKSAGMKPLLDSFNIIDPTFTYCLLSFGNIERFMLTLSSSHEFCVVYLFSVIVFCFCTTLLNNFKS